MSITIGIIGAPRSGQTTLFAALTGGAATEASHHAAGVSTGAARVPEPRLESLVAMFQPKKVVPLEIRFTDVAVPHGPAASVGIAGEALNLLSQTDMLLGVVRTFADDTVPHPAGGPDAARDIAALETELALADMAIIERRLEKLTPVLKSARPPERDGFLKEQAALLELKILLQGETPLRQHDFTHIQARLAVNIGFLSAKPLVLVVNIGEEDIPRIPEVESELSARYAGPGRRVIAVSTRLELELSRLDDAAAAELRAGYGLTASGIETAVRACYEMAGLISFFTTASGEVSVRAVPCGTTAQKAAGKIHTDMERGFIRAEVVSHADLVAASSLTEVKRQGRLHIEGKDYIVRDGDVITFLFNV